MMKPIITVSLLAAAMIFTTFGSHLIANPIQAKTSTHDNSKHDNSKHDNSKHDNSQPDNSSQTIKVSCSDLAGVLAALNQAHAELTPSGKTNLDDVLSQEGVATSYDSLTPQLNIMAQHVHDICPQASSSLVKGA
jgi:hypothetical protein